MNTLRAISGATEDPLAWVQAVKDAGTIGLLLLGAYLILWKRKLVPGWAYDEMVEDRNQWRTTAVEALRTGGHAVAAAEEAVGYVKGSRA
jgi:hypothetical protein